MILNYSIKRKVYMNNTDCSGIIYHGTYLDWFLEARTELLEKYTCKNIKDLEVGFMPIDINLLFKLPLFLGDEVLIEVDAKGVSRTAIHLDYKVLKEDKIAVIGSMLLVCVKDGKPTKIPDYIGEYFA